MEERGVADWPCSERLESAETSEAVGFRQVVKENVERMEEENLSKKIQSLMVNVT